LFIKIIYKERKIEGNEGKKKRRKKYSIEKVMNKLIWNITLFKIN